jgi:hypothetical protein
VTSASAVTRALPRILADGDVMFLPRKVQRSRFWNAVEHRMLIYLHKKQMEEP